VETAGGQSSDRPSVGPPTGRTECTGQERRTTMNDGSPRIQAARWVIGVGRLYWGLSVAAAAWSLIGVWFLWSPVGLLVSAFLAGWATAWGALLRAFALHRRRAWQLLLLLAATGALWPAFGWLVGRPPTVGGLVSAAVDVLLLALLLHEDSREWVAAEEPRRPLVDSSAEPSGGGR
jgi:hypothetical protein